MVLGCTTQNNDVYFFFENGDIERLETERLRGNFVNFNKPEVPSSLEARLDEKISGRIKTPSIKDNNGVISRMVLLVKREAYQKLRDNRTFKTREGERDIYLLDTDILEPMDKVTYNYLKNCIDGMKR